MAACSNEMSTERDRIYYFRQRFLVGIPCLNPVQFNIKIVNLSRHMDTKLLKTTMAMNTMQVD